jgi:hypothetical protein
MRLWKHLLGPLLLLSSVCASAQTLGTPTTLEYGEVVVDPGGGNMTTDPSTGAITSATGIYPTSTLATTSSATLATGRAGRTASLYTTLTGNITMTRAGGGATFGMDPGPINSEYNNNQFTFPNGSGQTSRTFHLAGTITIPAGQMAGDYTGVLPIFISVSGTGAGTGNSNTVNVPIHIRIIAPIALSKTQDLDIGTVIPGSTAGTVTLNPATGAQGLTGGVLYAASTGQPAQFAITGEPSHNFFITLGASSISLTGPGGSMNLSLTSSLGTLSSFSGTGTATLNLGGTLSVAANQAEGDYSGTLTVTVAYP